MTSSRRSFRSADRPRAVLLAALLLLVASPGCYTWQASVGQLRVLWGRKDVDEVLRLCGLSGARVPARALRSFGRHVDLGWLRDG